MDSDEITDLDRIRAQNAEKISRAVFDSFQKRQLDPETVIIALAALINTYHTIINRSVASTTSFYGNLAKSYEEYFKEYDDVDTQSKG
jgi:hypothetical protein